MRVACVQLNASDNTAQNLDVIARNIVKASEAKAQLVCFPENCSLLTDKKEQLFAESTREGDHSVLKHVSLLAKQYQIWVFLGSVPVFIEEAGKLANRSFVFDSEGNLVERYDKIHLFDACLGSDESYLESKNYIAGSQPVAVSTPWCDIGLTICYDIRFPGLYRYLAQKGAKIICIPAAFAVTTGRAHWEILIRARAIETGSYVIAAAQYGTHAGGRQTYGHSMIVNPWGEIIASVGGDSEALLVHDLDLDYVDKVRASVPNLACDSQF